MSTPLGYRFADLELDVGRRRLERAGQPIELGKLTYLLLVALVESAPNVLTHDELVRRVWGGRATSPETVTQRVKLLRDALQDDSERPRYIGLVRGQGYRLVPAVEAVRSIGSSPPARASVRRYRAAIAIVAGVLVLSIAAATYLRPPRSTNSAAVGPAGSGPLDYKITQLTTTGDATMPAISPDGNYVVYVRVDQDRAGISIWVWQIATGRDVEVLAPTPGEWVFSPTVSPDGNFIDFLKDTETTSAPELWRMPFLGGTPHRVREGRVLSPIGWSPRLKRSAFVTVDDGGNSSLVTMDDGAEEHVLAKRTVPTYLVAMNIVGRPSIRPAWSPDGRTIALFELADILAPRIVFVDTETGAETTRDSKGSFISQGLSWIGPSTLVLSEPGEFGAPIQLWRMSYPSGGVTALTNDLASYMSVDVDASRTRLVTDRRDVRTAVWMADADGGNAAEVVPMAPFSGSKLRLAWAGERFLYDATISGRAAIKGIAPGTGTAEEVVADAFHVAAAPDGSAIVYGSAIRGRVGLWKVDDSGRQPVQLVKGFAVEPVVTRDRAVVYVSNVGGVQAPWIVPLDGGEATPIVHEDAEGFDVSPDGRWLAFLTYRSKGPAFVVCELPGCSSRRELQAPENYGNLLRWTPDGKELAYTAGDFRNIWAVPLDGGAPHAITSFAHDAPKIPGFAWSRDGHRLAFIRYHGEDDIVLLTELRP